MLDIRASLVVWLASIPSRKISGLQTSATSLQTDLSLSKKVNDLSTTYQHLTPLLYAAVDRIPLFPLLIEILVTTLPVFVIWGVESGTTVSRAVTPQKCPNRMVSEIFLRRWVTYHDDTDLHDSKQPFHRIKVGDCEFSILALRSLRAHSLYFVSNTSLYFWVLRKFIQNPC